MVQLLAAAAADGLASFYEYSQLDRRRMAKGTAPVFFVTASQSLLLLSEAASRGWITPVLLKNITLQV